MMVVAGLSLTAKAWPQSSATAFHAASHSIYITHLTFVHTEGSKEDCDRNVIVSGDRISDVKDSKNANSPVGTKVIDGTNKCLIPGLWDTHVHIRGSINGSKENQATLPFYLANGITGVREMGGDFSDASGVDSASHHAHA